MNIRRICRISILAALYCVLSFLSFEVGKLTISFDYISVIFEAFFSFDCILVGFIGEFLYQILFWGLSATTLLWCIPIMLRALTFIVIYRSLVKVNINLSLIVASTVSALVTTVSNTICSYIDSLIYNYSIVLLSPVLIARVVVGIISSIIVCYVSMYLHKLFYRYDLKS